MPGRGGKGTTWTPELERRMLILAITAADLKPSTATWNLVAQAMGNGITASALSQKFHKLKKATENDNGMPFIATAPAIVTPPATPIQAKKGNPPAAAGHKRKGATTMSDESNAVENKAKQIKKESDNDGEHIGEHGGDVNIQDGHSLKGGGEPMMTA